MSAVKCSVEEICHERLRWGTAEAGVGCANGGYGSGCGVRGCGVRVRLLSADGPAGDDLYEFQVVLPP